MINLHSHPLFIERQHTPHLLRANRYAIFRGAKYSGDSPKLLLTIDIPSKVERQRKSYFAAKYCDVTIHIPESRERLEFAIDIEEATELMKQARKLSA